MFRFILPITFLFFAGSLYFEYIAPSFDKIDSANEEVANLKNTLDTNKQEIEKKIADLEKQMESISPEDEERLNLLVPLKNNFDEAAFISRMNSIAALNNMNLKGVQFSGGPDETLKDDVEDYGVFTMRFNVEGSYSKFIEFMIDIERSEPLLDVDVISFSSADKDDYNYGVSLSTYWLN